MCLSTCVPVYLQRAPKGNLYAPVYLSVHQSCPVCLSISIFLLSALTHVKRGYKSSPLYSSCLCGDQRLQLSVCSCFSVALGDQYGALCGALDSGGGVRVFLRGEHGGELDLALPLKLLHDGALQAAQAVDAHQARLPGRQHPRTGNQVRVDAHLCERNI